jgi:hypothetical protein
MNKNNDEPCRGYHRLKIECFVHNTRVGQGQQKLVKKLSIQSFTYIERIRARSFHPSYGRLGLCVGNGIYCKSMLASYEITLRHIQSLGIKTCLH